MTFEDELEAARRNAERRGIKIGEERGIKIGEERGIKIGEERGEKRGKNLGKMQIAVKLVREGRMSEGEAAGFAGVDPAELERELAVARRQA